MLGCFTPLNGKNLQIAIVVCWKLHNICFYLAKTVTETQLQYGINLLTSDFVFILTFLIPVRQYNLYVAAATTLSQMQNTAFALPPHRSPRWTSRTLSTRIHNESLQNRAFISGKNVTVWPQAVRVRLRATVLSAVHGQWLEALFGVCSLIHLPVWQGDQATPESPTEHSQHVSFTETWNVF